MKHLKDSLGVLLLAAVFLTVGSLSGCGVFGPINGEAPAPGTAASAPTPTQLSRIDTAVQQATNFSKASTQAAKDGVITWAQNDQVQNGLKLIAGNLKRASTVNSTDPAQAAQLLSDALTDLAKLQGASK